MAKLEDNGVNVSGFYEPDIQHQLTSICMEGTEKASKLTSSLPLAFKEYQHSDMTCINKHSINMSLINQ